MRFSAQLLGLLVLWIPGKETKMKKENFEGGGFLRHDDKYVCSVHVWDIQFCSPVKDLWGSKCEEIKVCFSVTTLTVPKPKVKC
jgi:hypothetical protein